MDEARACAELSDEELKQMEADLSGRYLESLRCGSFETAQTARPSKGCCELRIQAKLSLLLINRNPRNEAEVQEADLRTQEMCLTAFNDRHF